MRALDPKEEGHALNPKVWMGCPALCPQRMEGEAGLMSGRAVVGKVERSQERRKGGDGLGEGEMFQRGC